MTGVLAAGAPLAAITTGGENRGVWIAVVVAFMLFAAVMAIFRAGKK